MTNPPPADLMGLADEFEDHLADYTALEEDSSEALALFVHENANAILAALRRTPSPVADEAVVERVARSLYAASCALDPLDAERQPEWGRGGYKTEVMYWHGLARAALQQVQPLDGLERVRERCADAVRARLYPKNPHHDWTEFAETRAEACEQAIAAIRQLDVRPEGDS